jgi:hypothetical protein
MRGIEPASASRCPFLKGTLGGSASLPFYNDLYLVVPTRSRHMDLHGFEPTFASRCPFLKGTLGGGASLPFYNYDQLYGKTGKRIKTCKKSSQSFFKSKQSKQNICTIEAKYMQGICLID